MPQIEIKIGGRSFEVACQDGEEHFLHSAAAMLDVEASHLADQIGRMPEARMLLMAGLMLADKTAGLEDKLRESEAEAAQLRAHVETMQSRAPERIEVPVVPQAVTDALAEIAARAEALADQVEAN
ncbi:cell division protein ZapA [Yoonia sp. 2307UL14-13]|uniref:cell division protein ZapA n=1 Tax=Yoonia sp. 2307UL14-13 TaxID=3126506 RepID=UPI0030B3225E